MRLTGKARQQAIALLSIVFLVAAFFVAHIVKIYDLAHANSTSATFTGAMNGSPIGTSAADAIFYGIIDAISSPLDFTGATLPHLLIGWFLVFGLGAMSLVVWKAQVDLGYSELHEKIKNSKFWFGEPSALRKNPTKHFIDKHKVTLKNGSEKYVEEKKDMPEWAYYYYKYVADYSTRDQQLGLPDKNVLIGKQRPANLPTASLKDKQNGVDPSKHAGIWLKFAMDPGLTDRNLNTLVMGGSGTGKTFRFLEPNLAQMNCSFAVTDPSGEIFQNLGHMLLQNGYRVWLLSTSDPKYSNCYNPLDYIYDGQGRPDQTKISTLVNTFIKNANGSGGGHKGDPFWEKSTKAWLTFAVLYCVEFLEPEKRNFASILKLAQMGKADEESSSSKTLLDTMIDNARKRNPKAKCFASYETFSIAPAKTRNSILISIAVDLVVFDQDEIKNLTSTSYACKRDKQGYIIEYLRDKNGELIRDNNNIDLPTIGDRKTALFLNTKTAADAYQFLISMLYSQLFGLLYDRAEKVSPNSYHIYAANNTILTSQYPDQETAEQVRNLYAEAEVKTLKENGTEHYYLYNKVAKAKYCMIDKLAEGKKGYLEEIFSPEIGHKLIEQYATGKVKRGTNKLPIHTRLLLDEFANISEIPSFSEYLATVRKYEISCTIILQTYAQLQQNYDKQADTLVGQCDTLVFLGSPDVAKTCDWFSKILGKTLLKIVDTSQSKSHSGGSTSTSYKTDAMELISASNLASLDNEECIIVIRGENPIKTSKMSFADHPNFPLSGIANPDLKLRADFIESHYLCKSQKMAADEKPAEGAIIDKAIVEEQKIPDGSNRPIRTRRMRPHKLENAADLAEAFQTTPENLPRTMRKVTTPAPSETSASANSEITPISASSPLNFDFEFKTNPNPVSKPASESSDKPAAADNSAGSPAASSAGMGPNADATWVFL